MRSFPGTGVSWHYNGANALGCPGMMMMMTAPTRMGGVGTGYDAQRRRCIDCPRRCCGAWTAVQCRFRIGSVLLALVGIALVLAVLALPSVWFVLYSIWAAEGCDAAASWWLLGAGIISLLMCCCCGGRLCYYWAEPGETDNSGLLLCVGCAAFVGIIIISIGVGMPVPARADELAALGVSNLVANVTTASIEISAGLTDACYTQLLVQRAFGIAMLVILILVVIVPCILVIVGVILCLRCLDDCVRGLNTGRANNRR